MVEEWIGEFKQGSTSTNDAEQSGKPKDVSTPEIIEKIDEIILYNPQAKVRELAKAAGISLGQRLKFCMRKPPTKWMPCLLTIDEKRQRLRDAKSCLVLFILIQVIFPAD